MADSAISHIHMDYLEEVDITCTKTAVSGSLTNKVSALTILIIHLREHVEIGETKLDNDGVIPA